MILVLIAQFVDAVQMRPFTKYCSRWVSYTKLYSNSLRIFGNNIILNFLKRVTDGQTHGQPVKQMK